MRWGCSFWAFLASLANQFLGRKSNEAILFDKFATKTKKYIFKILADGVNGPLYGTTVQYHTTAVLLHNIRNTALKLSMLRYNRLLLHYSILFLILRHENKRKRHLLQLLKTPTRTHIHVKQICIVFFKLLFDRET